MIVSWNWLKEYVDLDMPLAALTDRLTMTGLNLEGVQEVDDDFAIDLEVTSNRPDCLGHIGVAREVAVLYERELTIPTASPQPGAEKTAKTTSVTIECPDLCPRYIARVIRGVKVGPSPQWLQQRLAVLGLATVNNIVDITNYVLMECGQPLHAFDFDKLHGQKIVVRQARPGEKFMAINQKEYELTPEMCVIADADHPVALGGVMGGLETEISDTTVNVLIETADFSPLSVRNTARKLHLHSDSSYRFERGVDARQLDWASRRCCQLILELAGGELLDEPVFAGTPAAETREPVKLRFGQIPRILGIEIDAAESTKILEDLGLKVHGDHVNGAGQFEPPSWRRDLTREADLIEEVARIYGYEKIPEDVSVPLQLSERTHHERIVDRTRESLIAAGFYEAITLTFVSRERFDMFTPRGELPAIRVEHSSRKHENILRQSLIPSLLESRRENERHGTFNAKLFEIARVYLSPEPGEPGSEPVMLACISGQSFHELKGVVDALGRRINPAGVLTVREADVPQFAPGRGCELLWQGEPFGWLGELSREVTDQLNLRDAVTAAELDLGVLSAHADLVPKYEEIAKLPTVSRDLNFVIDEGVMWRELEDVVREAAGPLLNAVDFGGQYRAKQIGVGKKSYVVTLHYRAADRTLTNDEVEEIQQQVIAKCAEKLQAALR